MKSEAEKLKIYESVKTSLSKLSDVIISRYKKIVTGKQPQVDLKTLVQDCNKFFREAYYYIEIIIENETSKIDAALNFFNDGFQYKNESADYYSEDIRSLLTMLLQLLTESFTEYSFLHTGKAVAFQHLNDLNNTNVKIHTKIDRNDELKNNIHWFDKISNLKIMKRTLIEESYPCTILSFHSLFLMFHIIQHHLITKKYKDKQVVLDYSFLENIDQKLNEFKQYLKSIIDKKFIYFLKYKLSVAVKIECGIDSYLNKDCSISFARTQVICLL